ncbi:hypothetical protein SK128_020128 [Halocaridina rubra]|uniref:Ima1 N-terminal domain-containing protein n=1 Tax=Halocaridina rubra TaxID=373956 RepID=A0AAN8XCE9_HALRR
MDYETVLPAIAGVSGLFAGISVLYSKIRPRFPVKVNCWFCNKDTKVEYRYSEGWICPSCQQYNGFTDDGDYNRDIPEQYCESLNYTLRPNIIHQGNARTSLALGNGFCQTCNLNQTLKLRALADYTPIQSENYDSEIDEYKKRLERTYALCRQCEAVLHQTLGKQDSWLKPKLIAWRLHLSAEKKAPIISDTARSSYCLSFFLCLVRLFSLLIGMSLLLANIHHLQEHSGVKLISLDFGAQGEIYLSQMQKFQSPLVMSGLTLILLAIFGAGKETLLVSDAVTSFTWVGLLALCSSKNLLAEEDYNTLQVTVSAAALILTLWTLFIPRTFSNTRILKSPLNKSMRSNTSSGRLLNDSECTLDASLSDDLKNVTPPTSPQPQNRTSTPVPFKSHQSAPRYDIDADMGGLQISTPYKNNQVQPSTPFSPRALFLDKPGYNPKTNDFYCIQRNIISPSKLLSTKTITQSSWVAGGYWGSHLSPREFAPTLGVPKPGSPHTSHPLFPLSRSSSQSSGYISHNSGLPPFNTIGPCSLPNSRHGSVCGDLERGSVYSEPAYKTWVSPVSLHPSDSVSQCSYGRGRPRNDMQSLPSYAASVLSGSSVRKTPPSPSGSTACLFQEALTNLSDCSNCSPRNRKFDSSMTMHEQFDKSCRDMNITSSTVNRSPWFAFFLGMSIAANGFLIALLFWHLDLHSSIFGFK